MCGVFLHSFHCQAVCAHYIFVYIGTIFIFMPLRTMRTDILITAIFCHMAEPLAFVTAHYRIKVFNPARLPAYIYIYILSRDLKTFRTCAEHSTTRVTLGSRRLYLCIHLHLHSFESLQANFTGSHILIIYNF